MWCKNESEQECQCDIFEAQSWKGCVHPSYSHRSFFSIVWLIDRLIDWF